MEHPGARRLTVNSENIAILTSRQAQNVHEDIKSLINKLGIASSRAQGLSHTITTFSSFASTDCKLYILVSEDGRSALGFIKVGVRNLFLWDRKGMQHERKTLCLLDFFTSPNCQRKGYGRKMIDFMLLDQHKAMKDIPIDRPSSLCLAFMKKHFGLKDYVSQANNYVVFDQYWESSNSAPLISSRPPSARPTGLNRLGRVAFQAPQEEAPQVQIAVRKENNAMRTNTPMAGVFKAICNNPAKRTHFNPITWSIHPGVDQ